MIIDVFNTNAHGPMWLILRCFLVIKINEEEVEEPEDEMGAVIEM